MAFERPITIKEALDNIRGKRYAMPAIQREFVWSAEQIERLFDSLMQGYPIGAFLFWRVEPGTVKEYRWYSFMRDYHQRDRSQSEWFEPLSDSSGLIAILDGQQRLTALNIGLRGTYASKLPKFHWKSPHAYPETELFMNVAEELVNDESGMKYEFRFMVPEAVENDGGQEKWFRVPCILGMDSVAAVWDYMVDSGLMHNVSDEKEMAARKAMQRRITSLWQSIHVDAPISYYLEPDQELEKVLNIFIRTNSGGTVLSTSDLLLSVATAQWHHLDAREEVNERTDELNEIGEGFNFPRDFVLRAGVVLADISDVGFHVRNFTPVNMRKLEDNWESVTSALRMSVELAARFGLSGDRLDSQNSLIPIAYYLNHRNVPPSFLTRVGDAGERDTIRQFLFRTLIGRVWGGSSDTLLTRLRNEIRNSDSEGFPYAELSAAISSVGRSVSFDDEQLEEIVETAYGRRAFVLLSLLFPDLKVGELQVHMDHFFPKSRMSRGQLRKAGIESEQVPEFRSRMNRLPNLVLLLGSENTSKGATPPLEWLKQHFESESQRRSFLQFHDLGDVPEHVSGFVDWYEDRRARMLAKLRTLIGRR